MKRALWILPLLLLVALPLASQSLAVPTARAAALGGLHVALADDIGTLFSNPAGFRLAGPEFSITDVGALLTGPVFSIADLAVRMAGGADPLTLIADPAVQDLLNGLHAAATLGGPFAVGYVGHGFGIGLFNTSYISLDTVGTIPTVGASVVEELLLAGGYALRIPLPPRARSTLDVGVELKAFATGSVALSKSIIEMLSLLSSPSPTALLDQPLDFTVGFGVDAGVLYQWNKTLAVGLVGRNLATPFFVSSYPTLSGFVASPSFAFAYGGLEPIDVSAGVAFTPQLPRVERYVSGLKVLLDYSDILDFVTHPATARNWVLHFGLGLEATLLEVLALRAGFGDGYFGAGVGLDMTIFRLDVSMFGSELSTEPGMRPAYNLLASISFVL